MTDVFRAIVGGLPGAVGWMRVPRGSLRGGDLCFLRDPDGASAIEVVSMVSWTSFWPGLYCSGNA